MHDMLGLKAVSTRPRPSGACALCGRALPHLPGSSPSWRLPAPRPPRRGSQRSGQA